MIKRDIKIKGASVLVMGFTFKENCPDVRNTRVIDIITVLNEFGINYTVFDPWADATEVLKDYAVKVSGKIDECDDKYDSIVLAVSHDEFIDIDYSNLKRNKSSIIYDIKGMLNNNSIIDGGL